MIVHCEVFFLIGRFDQLYRFMIIWGRIWLFFVVPFLLYLSSVGEPIHSFRLSPTYLSTSTSNIPPNLGRNPNLRRTLPRKLPYRHKPRKLGSKHLNKFRTHIPHHTSYPPRSSPIQIRRLVQCGK